MKCVVKLWHFVHKQANACVRAAAFISYTCS